MRNHIKKWTLKKIWNYDYPLLPLSVLTLLTVILGTIAYIFVSKDIPVPEFIPIGRPIESTYGKVMGPVPVYANFDETGNIAKKSILGINSLNFKYTINKKTSEVRIETDETTDCKFKNGANIECAFSLIENGKRARVIGNKNDNTVKALILELSQD